MLGVGGTLIAFVVIGLFTYVWSEAGLITNKHGDTIYIKLQDALMVGATLSATDVVCTLALVKEQKTPRLHSILFGESASNDAIAILLLASLEKVSIDEISAASVFTFIGEFIYNCVTATLMGILFGALSAYITKKFRSLRDWPSRETAMLLYIAWIGYVVAELLDVSGVICILACAIVSGHYAMYNLSPPARIVSHNFFHFVGDASEALVFAYLGLTAYSYNLFSVSYSFLFALFGSTMIARFCGTIVISYIITLLTCGKHDLGIKNLLIIWFGGVARGGVSFALVLTISGEHSEALQDAVLALVILGTLIFGTVLPLWIMFIDVKEASGSIIEAGHGHGHSEEHADVLAAPEEVKKKGWLHRKWRHIDDHYIKRWLIHEDELRDQAKIRESMTRHRDEADGEIVPDDRVIH